MLRMGGGDRQSLCSRLEKYMAFCGSTGTSTYPAMVLGVSFQEQSLMRDYAQEGRRAGTLQWDPEWQTRIRCSSLHPKYGVT